MTVKVTLEFDSITTASEFMRRVQPGTITAEVEAKASDAVEPEVTEPDAKPTRKSSKKQSRKSKADAAPKEAEANTPSKDDVRKALSEVGAKHGIEKVREICTRFGASGIRDLAESQYADVIMKCEGVINGD